jgi:hypothetical protein
MAECIFPTKQSCDQKEDNAGFWIETPDGTIWAPGDSRLIPEHHPKMPAGSWNVGTHWPTNTPTCRFPII